MMLFIDTDRAKSTGWNGYDYIVNRVSPESDQVIIEKNVEGRWEWEPVAKAKFASKNNRLELEIKRSVLNLTGKKIDLEFKWNDNMQENSDGLYLAPGSTMNHN